MESLGPYQLNTIITGDARELAREIPDESVDLIFTDPIYDRIDDYRWLAETAARVLKPGGNLLAYSGFYWADKVLAALSEHLHYRWCLIERKANARAVIWQYKMFSQTKPLFWYSKGDPVRTGYFCDFRTKRSEGDKVNHKWSKGLQAPLEWITAFDAEITFDPFTGGGTVPAVCKMLGRNYLAFEIDPTTADNARRRVEMTQPPLFVLQPEQMEIPLE